MQIHFDNMPVTKHGTQVFGAKMSRHPIVLAPKWRHPNVMCPVLSICLPELMKL